MAGLFSTISGALLHGASYFIYPGHFDQRFRRSVQNPSELGLPYEDLILKTPDGLNLHAYLLLQPKSCISPTSTAFATPVTSPLSQFTFALSECSSTAETSSPHSPSLSDVSTLASTASPRHTVLILHGNGDNIGCWLSHAEQFYGRMGCNVLLLEYRGFGKSEGYPTERGLQIDAQTALDYIDSHPELALTPLILYGQSLGGAVAIDLASRHPNRVRALILENTPLSLRSLLPHALAHRLSIGAAAAAPLAAVLPLAQRLGWDSASKATQLVRGEPAVKAHSDEELKDIDDIPQSPKKARRRSASTDGPDILLLSGLRDTIVPPAQMRALWEIVQEGAGGANGCFGSVTSLVTDSEHFSAEAEDGESVEDGTGYWLTDGWPGQRCHFVEFERGGHNDTSIQPGYWCVVANFVSNL